MCTRRPVTATSVATARMRVESCFLDGTSVSEILRQRNNPTMSKRIALTVALLLWIQPGSSSLSAQAPKESAGPFGALKWRSVGPARGGRSIAAEGSVARPSEYYMGATGGGLWKSTDGGTTW